MFSFFVILTLLCLLLLKPFALWLFALCYRLKSRGSILFYPAATLMIPTDVLFNLTWGSYIFGEWPREWTFSSRVRRHLRSDAHDKDSYIEAVCWMYELNSRWPDHIQPT